MAAGMGSRYGGLKQIDPIGPNGETIMDYSVFDAVRAGFGKLVFIIRRDIEEVFKRDIGSKFEDKLEVEYVNQDMGAFVGDHSVPRERVKPWGTGHAVLVTSEVVNEPFAVINADDFYGADSFKMMADYLKSDEITSDHNYAMVGYILRNTLSEHGHVSRGVCDCDDELHLKKIVERTKVNKQGDGAVSIGKLGVPHLLTGSEIVSMNFWGFDVSIFESLEKQFSEFLQEHVNELDAEYYLPAMVDNLINSGQAKVKVLKTRDKWFGVTYPEDKISAQRSIQELIEQEVYPEKLW